MDAHYTLNGATLFGEMLQSLSNLFAACGKVDFRVHVQNKSQLVTSSVNQFYFVTQEEG
jgi:hypothetical protein